MSRFITATDAEAVDPGVYPATLKYISDGTGQYGPYFDWTFEVQGPQGPAEVDRRTSQKMGPATIARKIIEALLGRRLMKGEQVDLDSLIGRPALVKVVTNDNGYSTIDDISPYAGQVPVAAQPQMPAAAPVAAQAPVQQAPAAMPTPPQGPYNQLAAQAQQQVFGQPVVQQQAPQAAVQQPVAPQQAAPTDEQILASAGPGASFVNDDIPF